MTRSLHSFSKSKRTVTALAAISCAVLLSGCNGTIKDQGADRTIKVVVKNESGSAVQGACLWSSKDNRVRELGIIPAGGAATGIVNLPNENNIDFEFRRGAGDWRHLVINSEYTEDTPLILTIDEVGDCRFIARDSGHTISRTVFTRPANGSIVSLPPSRRPAGSYGADQVELSGPLETIKVEHAPSIGPVTAPITVVEFCDFSLPICAEYAQMAHELLMRYPRLVRLVFKHDPTSRASWIVHEAALAAGDQGKFWEMHDKLFSDKSDLTPDGLITTAKQLHLNMARFESDLRTNRFKSSIESDRDEANQLELFQPPNLAINGCIVTGLKDRGDLDRVVAVLLKQVNALHSN